jgi:hypothetical protein
VEEIRTPIPLRAPPPQDGVSTNFTTTAMRREYPLKIPICQVEFYLATPFIGANTLEIPSTNELNPSTTDWKSVTNNTIMKVTSATKKNLSI